MPKLFSAVTAPKIVRISLCKDQHFPQWSLYHPARVQRSRTWKCRNCFWPNPSIVSSRIYFKKRQKYPSSFSITPLSLEVQWSYVVVSDAKIIHHIWSDLLQLQTTVLQFRGRVNLLCRSDHSWVRLKKFAICMYNFFSYPVVRKCDKIYIHK